MGKKITQQKPQPETEQSLSDLKNPLFIHPRHSKFLDYTTDALETKGVTSTFEITLY